MKTLALMLALACNVAPSDDGLLDCGADAPIEKGGDSLSFGRYAGDHGRNPGELWAALECAGDRWRAATCLDADVSLVPETWVRWGFPEEMYGYHGMAYGSSWTSSRIMILDTLEPHKLCQVMAHEMGHILRRDFGHPGPDHSMSYPVTHISTTKITQFDIDAVCDYWPCGCETPE